MGEGLGRGCLALSPPFGGERAFHGGFQQGLAVLPQLLLRGLELGHAGIEVGEQFFELGDNASLLCVTEAIQSGN